MSKQNTYRLRTVICTLAVVLGLLIYTSSNFSSLFNQTAAAAPSTYLNFQGRLKNASGSIVPDGNYNIEFKIYDAMTGGNLLWTETRTGSDRVRVANGYFSVSLGSVTAFGTSIPDWSEQLFITMNIGGTGSPSWDGEMTNGGNRMILTAVPYAFQADKANSLTDGTNDFGADDFVQLSPSAPQAVNSADAAVAINQIGAGSLLQLQSNGTDIFTLSNSGDAVLAGGLTVGEDLAVGTNSLVVDSANDRVGIGTATTSAAVLTVVGTAPDAAGGAGLRVEATLDTTTNNRDQYGNTFLTTVSPSGAGGSSAYFGLGGAITSSANLSNDMMTALSMGAVYSGTTSAARVQGIDSGAVNASTGSVNELIGQAVTVTNVGGTVNYAVGMNIGINNAATINNRTYLLIGASAIPTGNWGIYNDSTYANYFAGSLQVDSDGAASAPGVNVSGNWYTGGTSTTTTPQLLIQPTGTASTTWDTSGTAIGVNAASGFVGTLLDLKVNNDSKFVFDANGTIFFSDDYDCSASGCINSYSHYSSGYLDLTALSGGLYLSATQDINLSSDQDITIGSSDTTGTLLVLDTKTNAGNPSGVNGGMYYNSNDNAFRFYQNGSWVGLGTGDILNGGNTGAITIGTNNATSLTFETNNQSAMTIASGGAVALQNATNSTTAFTVTNTSGNSPLIVDTTGTYGKVIMSALQFSNSAATSISFTTPQGSTVNTKILIPLHDPGAGMQHIALGLPAGAVTNTRAITLFDNRSAGNNQPVLAVLSPNENNIFGLNTDGSNTVGWLKGVGMNVGLRVGTTDFLQTVSSTGNLQVGTSDTTGQLLVLDTKTDAGDPTGVAGGMYYNSNSGKFRCYENSTWVDCIQAAGGGAVTLDGNANLFGGTGALGSLTSGTHNLALGANALGANTSGSNSIALGQEALRNNETGSTNIAIGSFAMYDSEGGDYNIALGSSALNVNTGQGNVALGHQTLNANTSGYANVAIGMDALQGNATGSTNIGIGQYAMGNSEGGTGNIGIGQQVLANTTGEHNIALGTQALYDAVAGDNSIALGAYALQQNSSGEYNIALGRNAMIMSEGGAHNLAFGNHSLNVNEGDHNIALGQWSLGSNTTGGHNVALGYSALSSNTDGASSVAIGSSALAFNASGFENIAIGKDAMQFSDGGSYNIALGSAALQNSTGGQNIALGMGALNTNTSGNTNIAIGWNSLLDNDSGSNNIGLGVEALANSTGSNNIALGVNAGDNLTSGDSNIIIGYNLDFASSTGSNQLNIAGILTSSDYTSGNLSVAGDLSLGLNGSGEGILSLYGSEGNAATIAALNSFGGTIMTFQASGVNDYVAQFRDCCNAVFEVGATGIASRFNYGLEVDGGGIVIGDIDTTGELLVLDTKTDAGDPTGVNGGMYYNSDSGKFRCYEGGAWKDCISAGTGDVVNGGQNGTVTLGTNDSNPLNFETGGNTHMSVEADGDVVVQNGNSAYSATAFRVSDATDDWRGIVVDTDTQGVHLGAHDWTDGFDGGSGFSGYFENNALGYMNGESAWTMMGRLNGSTALTQTSYMMEGYVDAAPDNTARNYRGINMRFQGHNLSANTINSNFTGVRSELQIDGSGSASNARAFEASSYVGSASTVANLYGNEIWNTIDGTVTNNYGIRIGSTGSGTVTNNYGMFIDNQTIGTNDYGLYINGADNFALYVSSGNSFFGGSVNLNTSDTTGNLLMLDTKTDSGDPGGVDGAMYYNSDAGKFRCYEDGSWVDCIGNGDIVNGGQNGGVVIGTNDSNALGFETNGTTRWNINTSGHLLPGADDTYDIGSDSLRVRDLYLGPASLHIGESGDEVVLSFDTVNNILSINQSLSVQGDIISNGTSLNLNAVNTQDVNIATGTSTGEINIGNANSGDVSIYSSGTVGMYGNGGSVGIEVGSVFGLSVNTMQFSGTGTKNIRTTAQSTQHSAGIDLYTGNVTGGTSRNTGDLSIRTGNGSGTTTNSGSITIDNGSATGTAGTISIGAANTSGIVLGRNGINVNVAGNLTIGTSDTTGTLLVLDTKTNTGDPSGVAGGMYYNSATQSFRCYNGTAWRSCFGGLAVASTAPSNTISGTTAETNFSGGTGNSYTIPANTCTVGRTYRVTASGLQSFAGRVSGSEATVLKLKLGSTTIATTDWTWFGDSAFTDQMWRMEAQFTCTETPSGASAIEAQGFVQFFTGVNSVITYNMKNTSTVDVATNANQTVQIAAQIFNNAAVGDSITMRQFIVEDLGY